MITKKDVRLMSKFLAKTNDGREFTHHFWISDKAVLVTNGHAILVHRYNEERIYTKGVTFDRSNLGEFKLCDLDPKSDHDIQIIDGALCDNGTPINFIPCDMPNINSLLRNLTLRDADRWLPINAAYNCDALQWMGTRLMALPAYITGDNAAIVYQNNCKLAMIMQVVLY